MTYFLIFCLIYLFFAVRFQKLIQRTLYFISMLIINIKDNESIDRALKRYKKKFERTGTMRQLRARTAFEKPSVRRRFEVLRAVYKEKTYGHLED
jgi:small subunit ribosomal protein S21